LKYCANLTMLFQKESAGLMGRYELAKKAGFAKVETPFPYELTPQQLSEALESNGLDQVLINTEPGDSLGMAALHGKQAEFMASLTKSIEYCKASNCKLLHIMSGCTGQQDFETSLQVYKENLKSAVKLLAEHGILGVIEPISGKPGYFLNSFDLAEKVIGEINSPNLRLLLDIFHLQRISGNLTENIKKLLRITGHIQISQVPNRDEPDHIGEINYQYILGLLEKLEYDGFIGLEYMPKDGTMQGLQESKYLPFILPS